MRNKGAIKWIAILMTLVCLYQLSFTVVTYRIEKKANEYAKGDSKKKIFYKDSLSGVPVYNFLWMKNYTYRQCQEREFNLGLDLKGGMNVMMEVSVADVVKSLSNNSNDATFTRALALARERQSKTQDDFVTIFGKAFEEVDPNAKLASVFNTIQLRDRIQYNSTNAQVLDVLRAETKIAIANSVKILRARIDQFGVAQPNFQEMGTAGRVLIELPGIKDPERVRKLLQVSAKLEFWETYENSEVFEFLKSANAKMKELQTVAAAPADTTGKTPEQIAAAKADTTKTGSLLDKLQKDSTKASKDSNMEDFKKENPLFGLLQPNTDNNQRLLQGPVVGISHFRDTAAVNRILATPQVKSIFPSSLKLLWSAASLDNNPEWFSLVAIKISNRDGKPALDGTMVVNAKSDIGGTGNKPEVSLRMNGEGTKIWQRLTKENVGRSIAIVLDDYVRSNPTVQTEISGGSSSISGGGMTIQEAQDLANILNVGRMDAPAKIVQEDIVGPSLGREAINSGLVSFALAFLLILGYMVFFYNKSGLIANIALLCNVFFLIGIMASLGAVLTLPGIAGMVLSLAMSVDANVIINERIREELRAGKGVKLAVREGFKHSMSAIIDGNATSILTGVVLYIFGSGPIRGFATTLVIGILTSQFTAVYVSRLVFERLLDKERKLSFGTKLTENFLHGAKIKFLGKRKYAYIFSATLIVISLVSISIRGFNLGADFTGGRIYIVEFNQPVNPENLANTLESKLGGNLPMVTTFGNANRVRITTKYLIKVNDANTTEKVTAAVFEGCQPLLPAGTDLKTFTTVNVKQSSLVGPTVASDIVRSAVLAIVFALIGIFIYIFIRFRNWHFGLGGVVALFHDTIIVLGAYSLLYSITPFPMEVDQTFIAAILTIIGYSINDSVVIFDRVREYTGLYRKRDRKDIINDAIDSTLGRTLNTMGITLFGLLAIFIFGGASLRGFMFAMLIGIIFGTYSTIFIGSALVYDLDLRKERKTLKAQKAIE